MTLDEELREALSRRARSLDPAPDPLAGIERRARGIRRRRAAAAVTSTALAVLAVVGAGSLLGPDGPGRKPGEVATSAAPTPAATPSAYPAALDLADPWPYRGDRAVIADRDGLTRAWSDSHPGTTSVVPLFGQVWEPSGQPEVVVLARGTSDRWGVLTGSEAGWQVAVDQPLTGETLLLVAPLPGDETARLLVVAAPEATDLAYREDDRTASQTQPVPLAVLAPGVATGPLPGDRPDDEVTGRAGDLVFGTSVPDLAPEPAAAPDNVVDWPVRGGPVDPQLVLTARSAYATAREVPVGEVQEKVLFTGSRGTGRGYLLGQFWRAGASSADTFAVRLSSPDDVEPQLYRPLSDSSAAAAMFLSGTSPGGGSLVVVPRPGTGQVLYAPSATAAFAPVGSDDPALDGVVVFGRPDSAERAGTDRVRLLDGDGRELATLDVFDLLCGATSCG